MRVLAFASLAPLACVFASPVQAADDAAPVVLEPSSPWNVDFGEDKCRLARTFGEEGNSHVLFFEQDAPGATFGFTAAGPHFEQFDTSNVTTHFGEYPPVEIALNFLGANEGFGAAIIYPSLWFAPDDLKEVEPGTSHHSLPQIDLKQAATINSVSIRQGNREVVFMTGELSEATNVLNQCAQDLLNIWGLELDSHRTATRLPFAISKERMIHTVFSAIAEKIPRSTKQGTVRLRLIVDESGRVVECRQTYATMTHSFENAACKVLKRVRYKPALDKEGKPMRSYDITNITFRMN